MNVQVKNGVLTVKTGITEDALKKAYGKKLVAKDEKGNDVYAVAKSSTGYFNSDGIGCNQIADGELAYIEVLPAGTTKEQVLTEYGDALIAAVNFIPAIVRTVTDRATALEGIITE